ncbi:MAG: hypothetical protein O6913_06915 [Chloroflexi bacterium]|nr:hypothetical protein [Chloroflexota bacterium]
MLRRRTKSREDLQADYVAALIEMLKTQGKEGEADVQLMQRIERLLDLTDKA